MADEDDAAAQLKLEEVSQKVHMSLTTNDVFCNVEEFNDNDDLEEGFHNAQRWSEIIEGFTHYCLMKTHSHCVIFLDTVKGTSYPSEMC